MDGSFYLVTTDRRRDRRVFPHSRFRKRRQRSRKILRASRLRRVRSPTTARSFGQAIARRIKSSHLIAERFASSDPHARLAARGAAAALRRRVRDATSELGCGTERACAHRRTSDSFCGSTLPGALRSAFTPPIDLSAGRAFGAGLLDVEGDLEHAVDTLYRASTSLRASPTSCGSLRVLRQVAERSRCRRLREAQLRGRVHSRAHDRAAIGFHYDQPAIILLAAFSVPRWSIRAHIGTTVSIRSTMPNRLSLTIPCASCGCAPANVCSTSAAVGVHSSFGRRSWERRRSVSR